MGSVHALIPGAFRLALDGSNLRLRLVQSVSVLSSHCPVSKVAQILVISFVTVVLPHQLILQLELRQSAEGAAPEQVRLNRRE